MMFSIVSSVRSPVKMSADFKKRADKDVKKINKIFERVKKESETRREKMKINLDELVKNLDKTARDDVEKLTKIFEDDVEETIDTIDFEEVNDIITFKD